jgi:membrane protein
MTAVIRRYRRGLSYIKSLLSRTYEQWAKHEAPTLGASIACYTILSLAPLLTIAVAIVSFVIRNDNVQSRIVDQAMRLAGPAGADVVRALLTHTQSPKAGALSIALGLIVILFGASGVFKELRKALNLIWDVKPRGTTGWRATVTEQFSSFAMVIGVAFLLLTSLVVTTAVEGFSKAAEARTPAFLAHITNVTISIIIITLLFALIYRFVPEQTLPWMRLWPGSLATAILFTVGKYLLGFYLTRAGVASTYGAAGSPVVLLVWVYYSAQLFLFGAEFTHVYACDREGRLAEG